ncbi:tungstate transport system ATP-binding protein [Propionispira arboris]|uniref:Tungstate transport system ATP-binding protein n=1 Tax=Propionispira arboris TaxID=84035 RepID=A0A1H6XSB9_9FIRM|nr:ABC transporter ATP-binding protein [Propionispira arboris]SEJ30494.1 tungstate transport system ATP-binding protein [Propionispira arboris]
MKEAILKMDHLQVQREGRQVLQIDHFQLKRGELLAIVGSNGAGKSTFLQTVNGLQKFSGKISLFGETMQDDNRTRLRRRMSMVFQETILQSGSVAETIGIGLTFREMKKIEILEKVEKVSTVLRCNHLLKRQSNTLSGGEKQRIGIARALITKPELLLLDEPFAALDLRIRREMITKIRAIAQKEAMSVILVTHDFAEALAFADRAIVIEQGKIVQDASPQYIMYHPVNEVLARLVGIENILSCQLQIQENTYAVQLQNGAVLPYKNLSKEAVSKCCIPADICIFANEIEKQKHGDWFPFVATCNEIRPSKNGYELTIDWQKQQLKLYFSRQKKECFAVNQEIEFALNLAELHLI